jgi:4-hydroxy-tetrahydrodipicolinate reductase
MTLKICLSGATGHVGQELVKGIQNTPDLELVSCLGFSTAGKRLPEVLNFPCPDLLIHRTVDEALQHQSFDVLIDYTHPESVYQIITDSIRNKINCVIGTSGLSNTQYEQLDDEARKYHVGVFGAGNFSVTAALMIYLSQIAAKYIPHWEILDCSPDTKPDAPSGTARELAYLLGKIGRPKNTIPPDQVHGNPGTRGAEIDGTQVHSIRVPGFYSTVETVFGLPGERVSVRHDSISYAPYVEGTLMAAKKVITMKGLVRGMNDLLGLPTDPH